jgi:adenine-specific DNA-methyltransferase
VDKGTWALVKRVYRPAVSLPFEPGDHKRVAVKIVDDCGIESLKTVQVEE